MILGGSGFLGVHVAIAATRAGVFDVVVASREPSFPADAGATTVRTRMFDALVQGSLEQILEEIAPNLVVLCTALPTIAACKQYPVLARKLNVELPAEVASWTAAHAAKLSHVSTDLVFGAAPPARTMYREDDPPSPASEYGRTKALGEAAVLRADPNAVVARLSLLYGESFGRGLGASDSLRAAIMRGERPVVFIDEWRTPIDVSVAARALVMLLDADASGIVHVAGRERMSRRDLAVRVLGVDPFLSFREKTRAAEGHASRPADVSLDTTRLRAILGEEWDRG